MGPQASGQLATSTRHWRLYHITHEMILAAADRPSGTGSTSTGGRNDVTVALDAASATQAQQQFHSAYIQCNFIAIIDKLLHVCVTG